MESKNIDRGDNRKLSKGYDDPEASRNIVRSSSFKAKDTENDDDNRKVTSQRIDSVAEPKPLSKASSCTSLKEEKEELFEGSRRIHALESLQSLAIQEEKIDSEFEELMHTPNNGKCRAVPTNEEALNVLNGFKIISMNMRDGSSGKLIWESSSWGPDMFEKELKEYIPKEILQCRTVSREINFQSRVQITKFRIEQRVFFEGQCVEEWFFSFGFVIPGSTNSWQQNIEAAPKEEMMSAESLSGNITFETSFFDDKVLICKNLVRIYYE